VDKSPTLLALRRFKFYPPHRRIEMRWSKFDLWTLRGKIGFASIRNADLLIGTKILDRAMLLRENGRIIRKALLLCEERYGEEIYIQFQENSSERQTILSNRYSGHLLWRQPRPVEKIPRWMR
jgi:hypothetical protein